MRDYKKTKELDILTLAWIKQKQTKPQEDEFVAQVSRLIGSKFFKSSIYNVDPKDGMIFCWKRVLKGLNKWDIDKGSASTYITRCICWSILDLKRAKIKEVESDKFAKQEIAELYKNEINNTIEKWRE